MKRKRLLWFAGALVAVGLLILGLGFGLGARFEEPDRSTRLNLGSEYRGWENPYHPDGCYRISAEGICGVELRWIGGDVRLLTGGDTELTLLECNSDGQRTPEEDALRWGVEDGILYIQHCARSRTSAAEKSLTVTLPDRLTQLLCSTVSADMTADGLQADTLRLRTVSGSVTGTALRTEQAALSTVSGDMMLTLAYRSLEAESISGGVTLHSSGCAEDTRITTSSGNIHMAGCSGHLALETISGVTTLEAAELTRLEANSSSGDMDLDLMLCPHDTVLRSISGAIQLALPADSAFTLTHRQISGELSSEIPLRIAGEALVAGDGGARLLVDSSSGDLTITVRP